MEIVLVYKENKIDCAFVFKRESRPGRDLKKQREQKKRKERNRKSRNRKSLLNRHLENLEKFRNKHIDTTTLFRILFVQIPFSSLKVFICLDVLGLYALKVIKKYKLCLNRIAKRMKRLAVWFLFLHNLVSSCTKEEDVCVLFKLKPNKEATLNQV